MTSRVLSARSRRNQLVRYRGPDDPATIAAARALAAEKLAQYVTKIVGEAPPLTDQQRTRIAALLRPVADTSTTAA